MDHLRNALANALKPGGGPVKAAPPAPEPAGPRLPDPLASEWVARMRSLGVEVPREPSLGQLTQRTDAACRQFTAAGRKRDARELTALKGGFLAQREKAAWGFVKDRFAALDLPEKTYRTLKQEGALPEKVLERLNGKRGEALRGAGHARVREALLG
jgi:hypothetical protein